MNTTRDNFVDFIPEGKEKGSPYGKGGFIDFVPTPEPKKQEEPIIETPVVETPIEEPKKRGKK